MVDLLVEVDRLGPNVQGHPALVLYLSDELDEPSQWLCHDHSIVNMVTCYYYYHYYYYCDHVFEKFMTVIFVMCHTDLDYFLANRIRFFLAV